MVEISSSGSGEGPGWVTSRPTLQRYFYLGIDGSAPPEPPPPGRHSASVSHCLRLQGGSLAVAGNQRHGGCGA
jgi:hypothetical protein